MKAFLLGLLISTGFFAQAAPPLAQDFLKQGKIIPQALLRLGYDQFGELNIKAMMQKMDGVRILSAPAQQIMLKNSDGRPTAHWRREAGSTSVTVSPEFWDDYMPETKPLIALHEFLGGVGFDDTNYHLSSALWLLSTPEAQKNLNPGEQKIIQNYISKAKNTGGVIGVGGGGDVVSCYVKKNVLLKKLRAFAEMRGPEREQGMSYLFLILNMDINLKWKQTK